MLQCYQVTILPHSGEPRFDYAPPASVPTVATVTGVTEFREDSSGATGNATVPGTTEPHDDLSGVTGNAGAEFISFSISDIDRPSDGR